MKTISNNISRNPALIPETTLSEESNYLKETFNYLTMQAINTLNEKEKHLVVLHGWYDCSIYEVAVIEHISVNAVQIKYSRIVKKIKVVMMNRFNRIDHLYKEELIWELS